MASATTITARLTTSERYIYLHSFWTSSYPFPWTYAIRSRPDREDVLSLDFTQNGAIDSKWLDYTERPKEETMPARFRAEQIGSLLRPAELLQARAAFTESKIPLEELRAKEDHAMRQALEKQRRVGIDILSDGEMRRGSWATDMAEAVEGFVPQRVELEWKGPGGAREGSTLLAAGAKLKKARKLTAHELPFLKQHAPGPFKVTVPAPSNFVIASYKAGVTDRFYRSHGDFLLDLVEIVGDEIQWLVLGGGSFH